MQTTSKGASSTLNEFLDQAGRAALDREAERRHYDRVARGHVDADAPGLPPAPKAVKPLQVYRASELYGKHLDAPPLIIHNMIPAGLTVLAGAPKRGKSWMALLMGVCVARGRDFMGLPTRQGDVLYLDLESRQYRIQSRLSKIIAGAGPDRLYISHDSERIGSGLQEQIEGWCKSVASPSLVIIDTLGRVKGGTRRSENAYESDTRIYGELQKFAMDHKLAIVCVHHLRKSGAGGGDTGDYFERLTGSMGIPAACDAVILLDGKRDDPTSTLRVTGRDFESSELIVRLQNGMWHLESGNSEEWQQQQAYNKSPVVRGVLTIMSRQERWEGSAGQLIDAISEAIEQPVVGGQKWLGREVAMFAEILKNVGGIKIYQKRKKNKRVYAIENIRDGEQSIQMPNMDAEQGDELTEDEEF